jgi:hypothetical protein
VSADETTIPEGLPEALPAGETLLWQGRPRWQSLAVDAFHVRKVAVYFGLLFAWRFGSSLYDGMPVLEAATYAAWILPLAAAAIVLLCVLAWFSAWTTVYTVTSKRVVMRVGIALQMTINLPYRIVESASLKLRADGSGDIALRLEPGVRAAYLVLWPHVRRWRFTRPEPSLRSVPEARRVADLMSEALAATAPEAAPAARTYETKPAAAVAANGMAGAMQPRVA